MVNIFRPNLLTLFLISLLVIPSALAQQRPSEPPDGVIRITTNLVQTDVTVVDKQGRFVEGLQREHFELLVDGKPQNISFLEQATAGSQREAALLTASGPLLQLPKKTRRQLTPVHRRWAVARFSSSSMTCICRRTA